MLAMDAIRQWQFNQLKNNIRSYQAIVDMNDPETLITYRDGGTGWTVLEVLCHLRDFEVVFTGRIQAMINEDNPALAFPNPDDLAATENYMDNTVADIMASWQMQRQTFLDLMQTLDGEQWERSGIHPTRGAFTPHDQLFLTALHDTIHLEQITRMLNEKR